MEKEKEIELMEIALKYVEKSYDYEQLLSGDDLYDASEEEKVICGNFWSECREVGIKQFRKMIIEKEVLKI